MGLQFPDPGREAIWGVLPVPAHYPVPRTPTPPFSPSCPRLRQETIEQLLSNMLEGEQSQSVIVSGIQVLLTLLEPRRPR